MRNNCYDSFPQFILDADELLYWCEALDFDHAEWHDMISARLAQENEKSLQKQDRAFGLNMLFCDRIHSEEMKALLTDLDNRSGNIKLRLLAAEIDDLLNRGEYQQVADAMIRLRRETDKRLDGESQENLLKLITKDAFCPAGSITEAQYRFCQTAHVIAMSSFMENVLPEYSKAIQRWTEQHKADRMLTLRFQNFSR